MERGEQPFLLDAGVGDDKCVFIVNKLKAVQKATFDLPVKQDLADVMRRWEALRLLNRLSTHGVKAVG